jgi:hypothetical protein
MTRSWVRPGPSIIAPIRVTDTITDIICWLKRRSRRRKMMTMMMIMFIIVSELE